MPKLYGANASPFVRKVRVALAEKGIDYDHDPVVPFNPSAEYLEKSPLGKIPCYEDDSVTLPDSSCILAYLDRAYPDPSLYPSDKAEFGRALWYEEYGDTRLVESVGAVFFQRIIRPAFFKEETDNEAVREVLEEKLPPVFDYLEGELGDKEFLVGEQFSIADIGIGSPFGNFAHGGEKVDAGRWPKLAAYVERIHGRDSFAALFEEERATLAQMSAA